MTDQEGAAMTPDIVTEARQLVDAADLKMLYAYEAGLEDGRAERPSVCPTCGSDDPQLFRPFRPAKDPWMLHGCPDPWHGGAE